MLTWVPIQGLEIATLPALAVPAPRLRVWFSPRRGGRSAAPFDSLNLGGETGDVQAAVRENRRQFLAALGVPPRRVVRGGQVHGSGIAIVRRGGIHARTDGFITSARDLALVINTADCFPLFLHSPSEMVLAALHVGRAGAAAGIVARAFDLLYESFHADPDNIIAVLGPGICARCHAVSRAEALRFPPRARRSRNGRWFVDLPAFIRASAAAAGLRAANWFEARLCTSCTPERCFSYRRDGGRTGRHWAVALMAGDPLASRRRC